MGWGGKERTMFKKRLFPYFMSEGAGGGDPADPKDPKDPKDPADPKVPTFDEVLKNKDYQAEFDRRVNKAISTALANEKKRLEDLADEKITEAEKLAKMNDLEKKEYLQKKAAKELAKREADLTKRELTTQAKADLAEKGLPTDLADLLDYSSADSVKTSMETVIATYNGAVSAGVEAKLKGGKPPREANNNDNNDEAAQNKEIYDAMSGGVF